MCADRKEKREAENYITRQEIKTRTKNNTDRGQFIKQSVVAIHS